MFGLTNIFYRLSYSCYSNFLYFSSNSSLTAGHPPPRRVAAAMPRKDSAQPPTRGLGDSFCWNVITYLFPQPWRCCVLSSLINWLAAQSLLSSGARRIQRTMIDISSLHRPLLRPLEVGTDKDIYRDGRFVYRFHQIHRRNSTPIAGYRTIAQHQTCRNSHSPSPTQ
jgi:hypothetical protein